MSNSYISADAISSLNSNIYEYKELIESLVQQLVNEFDQLNWKSERGQEFNNNELDTLKVEIQNILFQIDDEISPYLNELYEKVNDL